MKEITYELSHLSLKEKNIQEIAFKINSILNQFEIIQYSIDTDIKYRDNINNQLRSLQRDIAELSDRAYGSSRVINQAVTQFSNCERQLQNMLSQLLYTDSQLHKLPNTNIVANKPLKTDTQNWMKRIYNDFISHIVHLKSFFDKRKIGIHNTNNQVSKKTLTDIEKETIQKILKNIPELNSRLQGKPYNNQYIIKEIQKYICHQGIPIDVKWDIDVTMVTTLSMMRFNNLNLDNRFAQEDGYSVDGLNLNAYVDNKPIMHLDPTDHGKDGVSNEESDEGWFDLFNIDPKDVTRGVARWLIGNPVNAFITQHPYLTEFLTGVPVEEIFYAAGFVIDDDGVYHARQDALQQIGGYNEFYDIIFDYATSMETDKFKFNSEGRDYVFWAWKGDYLNLGAGAELGIYSNESGVLGLVDVASPNDDHWLVDTSLAMPMTLTLKDKKGNVIADYKPGEDNPQWWITAFNPHEQNVEASDLTVTYTIDFTGNETLYNDFINARDIKYDSRWSFDNYIATFEF